MVSLRFAFEDWIFIDLFIKDSYFLYSYIELFLNFSIAPLAITLLIPLLSMKVKPSY